jgi:hypothetical protein
MRALPTRWTGSGLALLAVATLIVASFSHVHASRSVERAAKPLECRVPFATKLKTCPQDDSSHVHCGVCLAASSAGAGVLPDAPVLVTRVVFEAVAFATLEAPVSHGVVTLPFQARGPPSL